MRPCGFVSVDIRTLHDRAVDDDDDDRRHHPLIVRSVPYIYGTAVRVVVCAHNVCESARGKRRATPKTPTEHAPSMYALIRRKCVRRFELGLPYVEYVYESM